jgi:ABC-type transport system substrate-binding protein
MLICLFLANVNLPQSVSSQTSNFSITIQYLSEDPKLDGIAKLITKAWAPLKVSVTRNGVPRPVYYSSLFGNSWDAYILTYEYFRPEIPTIQFTYSPSSASGNSIYRFGDTQRMNSAGIDVESLNILMQEYYLAQSKDVQVLKAQEFQRMFTNELLLDIPLVSSSHLLTQWSEFIGFDIEEKLVRSLYQGAHWDSNPSERQKNGRAENEIHYSLADYTNKYNPLYYATQSDILVLESLYSSLMLIDKNQVPHPNLATSYSYEMDGNGSRWLFTLRDDAFWSDGTPITAKDVAFTFELSSFEWIGSTNQNFWQFLSKIEIVNATTVSVAFSQRTLFDLQTIGSQLIIPEHVLNRNFTGSDEKLYTPYDGVYPAESEEWQEFQDAPITGGAYAIDSIKFGETITLRQNPNFWFPSELDLPDQQFSINSPTPQEAYYFITSNTKMSSLPIDQITFHLGGKEYIDENTARTLFENGQLDFLELNNLPVDDQILGSDQHKLNILQNPYFTTVILLNLGNTNLQNVDIRKALAHAINKDDLITFLGYGKEPQETPIPRGYSDYYDETSAIQHNYSRARDLFRENGLVADDEVSIETKFENPIDRISLPILPTLLVVGAIPFISKNRKQGKI